VEGAQLGAAAAGDRVERQLAAWMESWRERDVRERWIWEGRWLKIPERTRGDRRLHGKRRFVQTLVN